MKHIKKICFSFMLILFSQQMCWADSMQSNHLCKLLKSAKTNAIYLIDKDGEISKGPINLGKVSVSSNYEGGFEIPTAYKVISTSKSMQPINFPVMHISTKLIKAKNICQKFNTYDVVMEWLLRKGGTRPYKFEDQLPDFITTDQYGFEHQSKDAYQFDAHIIGELVEPQEE